MEQFFRELEKITNVKKDEPMKNHTTFKIGGPAKYFAEPENKEEIKRLIATAKEYDVRVLALGRGSNILVSDDGIDALVIHMGGRFSSVEVCGNVITAASGAPLSKIARCAAENSLEGFCFAAGIPGSLGGALYMNAGAYGGEMKDVVVKSYALDLRLNEKEVTDHNFGYRKSVYRETGDIILGAEIKLEKGDTAKIKAEMSSLAEKRREKQPVDMPSAGSVFKRPEGHFAGALIENAGLKGLCVGDAVVSEKHAGFIVNRGSATADDVKRLIELIEEKVYKAYGVMLEPEIKFI